jgi:Putative adhesin
MPTMLMSKLNRLLWGAGITLTALGAGPLAKAEEWTKQWPATQNPEIRVETGDGSVTVVGVPGSMKIEARVETRGWKIAPSEVRVDDTFSGNSLNLTVRVPNQHMNFGERWVKVTLRVPQEVRANVHTGDGSVRVESIHGPTRLSTGDGSITAEGLDGRLEAHTGDGSVKATGRFDEVQIHTKDGSVTFHASAGSKMASPWRLETGDGSVNASFPADFDADLDVHTGDGSISISDLTVTASEMKNEHDLRGRMNRGGQSLSIKTGDGSVSLKRS